MNKEMKDDYEKALKLYHKGKLKKSLKCCEEGVSRNLKNNSVLNLKGLILYLKGDLEGAITVWKINEDFNEDEMSKTYIKDAENDVEREREKEFEKARNLIKNLNINEAIESLKICKESDFNSIQVNNLLAICEIRKGEYDKSREYINKALEIDKFDENTLAIKKDLEGFTKVTNNKLLLIILMVSIITISLVIVSNLKNKEDKLFSFNNIVNGIEDKDKSNEKIDLENNNGSEIIENSNINKSESIQDIEDSKKSEDFIEGDISPEKIEESYINASTYFDEENYIASKDSLEKVVKQSYENHLNDDILFLIGSTYEKLGDIKNCEKYFKEYISLYENGDYIEEVYYKLALQYKSIDIDKSRSYAQKLIDNYPESMYNNENIDSILVN